MKKITLLLIFLLCVSFHIGCGSSSDKEEGEAASADVEAATDEGGGGGDVAAEGSEGGGDVAAEGTEGGDDLAVDGGGDEVVADLGDGGDEAALPEDGMDASAADAPPADVAAGGDSAAPAPEAAPAPDLAPEPAPEPVPVAEEPVPAPAPAPLLKIKDTPYKSHGRLLNTVYLARPGDTTGSVATKVYGDASKKKDLVADNPILNRGVKPGDKIYFQSTRRPDDASSMMTYYEDKGVPPQIYVTKEGDNIRTFAKDLLGYPQAWKEMWTTNLNVESKDVVPAGIELKYWPGDSAGGGDSALPQEPPVASEAPPAAAVPPPPEVAMNNVPPPPPPAEVPPPPPPPPMEEQGAPGAAAGMVDAPPPPPPPSKKMGGSLEAMGDKDMTMALGVGAILLIGAASLFAVVMKRSRSKKIKLSQTQV